MHINFCFFTFVLSKIHTLFRTLRLVYEIITEIMNVRFSIRAPKNETSSIRVSCTWSGNECAASTGIIIPTKYWKKNEKKLQWVSDAYGHPDINLRLAEIHGIVMKLSSEFQGIPSDEEVKEWIQYAIRHYKNPKEIFRPGNLRNQKDSFMQFFDAWRMKGAKSRTTAYNLIKEYGGKKLTWNDIDYKFYRNFVDFMFAKGMSRNYTGAMVKKIKTVMREGAKLRYHNNREYLTFEVFNDSVDNIYLTEEELDRIWNRPDYSARERKVVDMFFLGVDTAARYSDYSKLKLDNINDNGIIRFIQVKTNDPVMLPATARVLDILKRNKGKAPAVCEQYFNREIKKICQKNGLTDPIYKTVSNGGKKYTITKEKWELVSSHTARRTGATNMYKAGIPTLAIMKVTGHTSESSFLKYINISKEENARMLAEHPYFKR